jgi:AraC family transcriptional regulator
MRIGGMIMEHPTIEIKEIEVKVIYVRFKGSYLEFRKNAMKMFKTLEKYAKKHNLLVDQLTKVMTLYHDNPFITDQSNLRTSVALSVPLSFNVEDHDEIGQLIIKGKYAVLHYSLTLKDYEEAWKYSYHEWLFKSHHKPRDTFPFELYVTKPPRNFKDTSLTDIYIPIE